jgi:transcription-repair coupling factor (superfamily II helicase)
MPEELYRNSKEADVISGLLQEPAGIFLQIKGLSGSSRAAFIHTCLSKAKGSHLIILPEKEEAAYFYNDLTNFDGTERCLFFPSSYVRSIQYKKTDEANIITRTQVLKRLSEKRVASFIVSYPSRCMKEKK